MTSLSEEFEKRVAVYDTWINRICPWYEEGLNRLLEELPLRAHSILELGCGTGNLTQKIAARYPLAHITIVDGARGMLERTIQKVGPFQGTILPLECSFESCIFKKKQYDVVVASLALHHCDQKHKQLLCDDIYRALTPGGVFYLLDTIQAATPEGEARMEAAWIQFMRDNHVPQEEIAAALMRRHKHDKPDTLFFHFQALRKAGFTRIECVGKVCTTAVFGGRK